MPSEVLRDARRMLSPLDFCRLLSGLRGVDVADWRRHTRYAGGLQPDAKEVALLECRGGLVEDAPEEIARPAPVRDGVRGACPSAASRTSWA